MIRCLVSQLSRHYYRRRQEEEEGGVGGLSCRCPLPGNDAVPYSQYKQALILQCTANNFLNLTLIIQFPSKSFTVISSHILTSNGICFRIISLLYFMLGFVFFFSRTRKQAKWSGKRSKKRVFINKSTWQSSWTARKPSSGLPGRAERASARSQHGDQVLRVLQSSRADWTSRKMGLNEW